MCGYTEYIRYIRKKKNKLQAENECNNCYKSLRRLDTFGNFCNKENNLCNFLFAFSAHQAPFEKGSTIKGKNFSLWEQILSFYSRPFFQNTAKTVLTELSSLKVNQFSLSQHLYQNEEKHYHHLQIQLDT